LLGDFLEYPYENESFDFITSVATLHDVDASAALTDEEFVAAKTRLLEA
jgi:hypothetical protein